MTKRTKSLGPSDLRRLPFSVSLESDFLCVEVTDHSILFVECSVRAVLFYLCRGYLDRYPGRVCSTWVESIMGDIRTATFSMR